MAAMMENVAVDEIMDGWSSFFLQSKALLRGGGEVFDEMGFIGSVHGLCKNGLLVLVRDHFLHNSEKNFKENGVSQFWQHLDDYFDIAVNVADESNA